VAAYVEITTVKVPLAERRHYLACMEELRQLLAAEKRITRFLVLEDKEKLGQFAEIIEFASVEAPAALAADPGFCERLAAIDRRIETLLPGEKRERRVMVDRL
jgi:hypothetical protein